MCNWRQGARSFISFIVFFLLLCTFFIHCTYLFRNTDRNGRLNVLGFYYEEKDSIDVVFVGASNVYRYWDCMYAWNKYGFTSYDYSVSLMASATTISAIQDIEKHQKPELIVYDVRKLLPDFMDTTIAPALRFALDSQDFDFNRLKAVKYFCDLNDIKLEDSISEYIDLIQYHNNYTALSSEMNWKLMGNRINENLDKDSFYKGFAIAGEHAFIENTRPLNISEDIEELRNKSEKIYIDILEYCRQNGIDLLLVVAPYLVNDEEQILLERMEQIASDYGFSFLNTNNYYNEMALDCEKDFYDYIHVNIVGADKYTDFVAKYLVENYELPDHRTEPAFQEWNNIYQDYLVDAENAKIRCENLIADKFQALKDERAMQETDQVSDWFFLADNSNMTVFMALIQPFEKNLSSGDELILKNFGLTSDILTSGTSFIGVYNGKSIYSNSLEVKYSGVVGSQRLKYSISVAEEPQILIDNIDYFAGSKEGLHLLVFDNNINAVVDSVVLYMLEDGELIMEHVGY